MTTLVSSYKKRFVHIANDTGTNTMCTAFPHYYGPGAMVEVTEEEAERMHRCRKCFPLPAK